MSWNNLVHALDPVAWVEAADWYPDPWQREALESTSRKLLLNCSRQSGKSSVTAAIALHSALYTPGSLALIISPSMRQSLETFRKVQDFLNRMPERPVVRQESATQLELSNRSRILALPGAEQTIRGFSGSNLLILDEAARIEDKIISAVTPMLATTSGRLIALSTPGLKAGWFWREWTSGRAWHRVKASVLDCPRIDPEFVEDERCSMPPKLFAAEYFGEFMDAEDEAYFGADLIDALIDPTVKPLWPVLEPV
jgi:hypothetical protein